MPNNLVIVRSLAQTDLDTHNECLGFIRAALTSNDRQTARDIAAVLKDCYQRGYVDRAAIWAALSETEQQQFQELLAPTPLVRDFARRIREALGYQSPAVAGAVKADLERAIDAGNVTVADVVAVVGAGELGEFDRLLSFRFQPGI
jgi:hypothetical protein